MRAILLTVLTLLAVATATAQSEWEAPTTTQQEQKNEATKAKSKKSSRKSEKATKAVKAEDAPYLEGAVPMVDGRVVFSTSYDMPGKSAQQLYDEAYTYLDTLTKGDNQLPASRLTLINKNKHIVVANVNEWLVFSSSFIALDRTEVDYNVIVTCSEGHVDVQVKNINYVYERGRDTELHTTAEEWITDDAALNGKHTKLLRIPGKFRKKTVDRVNEIFNQLEAIHHGK